MPRFKNLERKVWIAIAVVGLLMFLAGKFLL
jgi:hypothetical protein